MERRDGTASMTAVVAARVRELRRREGWSAESLAKRCADLGMDSLNRVMISKIERGIRPFVTIDEMAVLAAAFGLPISALLGEQEPATIERSDSRRIDLNFPNPISRADDLHGRDQALARIEAAVRSRRPAVIMGERVMGKTSLMKVAAGRMEEAHGIRAVYLPHVSSRRGFIAELLDGVAWKGGAGASVGHRIEVRSATEFLHSVRRLAGDRKFLICLDELDSTLIECSSREASEILSLIEFVATVPSPIAFLFTLSRITPHMTPDYRSPFLNMATIVQITPWTERQTEDFVSKLTTQSGVVTADAHAAIFELAGGHPYFTKAILRELLHDSMPTISAADVERAERACRETTEVNLTLENLVRVHFDASEIDVLQRLATGSGPIAEEALGPALNNTRSLIERHYVIKKSGGYALRFGLLSRWLAATRLADDMHYASRSAYAYADDNAIREPGLAFLEVELQDDSQPTPETGEREFGLIVHNRGNAVAVALEIELLPSDAFTPLDTPSKRTLPRLSPGTQHVFQFTIVPVANSPSIPIQCTVRWSNVRVQEEEGPPDVSQGGTRATRTHSFTLSSIGARRRRFEMLANPYVFGSHITDPERFFGRRKELNELLSHLASRQQQNVVVRAPRRTGKTSLLHMIEAVLRDTDRRAGVRTRFDIPPRWDAALNATTPVRLDLQRLGLRKASAAEFYRAVLGALHTAGLRTDWSEVVVRDPAPTFAQFREGIADIVNGIDDLRLVILLDEFDVVAEMPDRLSFFDGLRTTVADVKEITWIIVSASGLYQDLYDYASPLFNVFQIKELGRLDDEAAKSLVLSPWKAADETARLAIADDAVETILKETGNHPWMLQMLCSEIVDYVNATRSNVVRSSTVDQVIQQRLIGHGSAADTYFEHMWDRASGVGKLLLLALLNDLTVMRRDELAAGAIQILHANSRADLTAALLAGVDRSLKQLVRMDAMCNSFGEYAYGVPLFRRVLAYRDNRDDGLARLAVNQLGDESSGYRHD